MFRCWATFSSPLTIFKGQNGLIIVLICLIALFRPLWGLLGHKVVLLVPMILMHVLVAHIFSRLTLNRDIFGKVLNANQAVFSCVFANWSLFWAKVSISRFSATSRSTFTALTFWQKFDIVLAGFYRFQGSIVFFLGKLLNRSVIYLDIYRCGLSRFRSLRYGRVFASLSGVPTRDKPLLKVGVWRHGIFDFRRGFASRRPSTALLQNLLVLNHVSWRVTFQFISFNVVLNAPIFHSLTQIFQVFGGFF